MLPHPDPLISPAETVPGERQGHSAHGRAHSQGDGEAGDKDTQEPSWWE